MVDEKYEDMMCKVPAHRLYSLLEAEAYYLALAANGVEQWPQYRESLTKYVIDGLNALKGPGSIFINIPDKTKENFESFVEWENNEIIKEYLQGEPTDEG